jgi:hypothetical protein
LIASEPNFSKSWIISESAGGPFIATIPTDVPANFLSRNGACARVRCGHKSKWHSTVARPKQTFTPI